MKNNSKRVFQSTFIRVVSIFIIFGSCLLSYIFNIQWLRIIPGVLVGGFLPGFLLIKVLFPNSKELFASEKIVLSITFSLLLSMAIALVLNLFPQGLRDWNIFMSLGGLVSLLLIISNIQDRRSVVEEISTGYPNKSLYVLLIPLLTLSTAILVISFFKIDRSINYVEFSIETINRETTLNNNGNEEFRSDLMVQNNTKHDETYVVNCLTEGEIVATTGPFIVNRGESKLVSLKIPINIPDDRLEFALINEDTKEIINRLWYQLK